MRHRPSSHGPDPSAYLKRVNLAIDYVVAHLSGPVRLADLANAARLSPFHFHRVFQAVVGETPADFVKRLRLERALRMMAYSRPASLSTIAITCGFASSSDFSRAFKQRYGSPPSRFDIKAWQVAHGGELEKVVSSQHGSARLDRLPTQENTDGFRVAIRRIPARTVAYIRVLNPYQGDAVVRAIRRLVAWAEHHSLADGQWLGYQWDNPEISSLSDCQYYAAVEADDFEARGEIGKSTFPAMTVAELEIRGGIALELRALQWLYGSWLPSSGYVPDDHPGFEVWIGRPFAHGMEYFEILAQIPVRRG